MNGHKIIPFRKQKMTRAWLCLFHSSRGPWMLDDVYLFSIHFYSSSRRKKFSQNPVLHRRKCSPCTHSFVHLNVKHLLGLATGSRSWGSKRITTNINWPFTGTAVFHKVCKVVTIILTLQIRKLRNRDVKNLLNPQNYGNCP